MKKPLLTSFLITACVLTLSNGTAWSEDAISHPDAETAAPAQRTPTRETVPGWYPPPASNHGWQAGPWNHRQPPSGYRTDIELKRLQDELAANRAELDTAHKELQNKEIALREALAALNRAHTEQNRNLDMQNPISEKLATATAENVALQSRVTQLTTELDTANASLARSRAQIAVLTDERNQAQNTLANRDEQLAESQSQALAYKNRLDALNDRLEEQKQAMLHARRLLAEINSARDNLRADLSASTEELTSVQATLAQAQVQAEHLRLARRDALIAETPAQPGSVVDNRPLLSKNNASVPDGAIEMATLEGGDSSAQGRAGNTSAALKTKPVVLASEPTGTADADRDGVPDSNDLCPGTADAVTVESTGCASGAAIPLEGVNFKYNSQELTDDARSVLDRVAGILSKNADFRIEVAGHTDSQGDAAYNQRLSRQRAQAVRDYLVSRGLGPGKISARGYGAQQPVADNTTVEGLARNRRVELRSLP